LFVARSPTAVGMKALALIAAILLAAPSSPAKQPHLSSVYTSIAPHHCKTVRDSKDSQAERDVLQRCPGYAGIPLFVEDFDARTTVSAGSPDGESCLVSRGCGFTSAGDRVEWRLANGKPFAIIYRLTSDYTDDSGKDLHEPFLIVETLKDKNRPACRIAEIPGVKPKANRLARNTADQVLVGETKCLRMH